MLSEMLAKKISDKPFIAGTNNFRCNFYSSNKLFLGKYQDCFLDDEQITNFIFPFLNIDDPYEATKEEILRAKWLEENKILHGDFKPA